ncbi:MAG: DUF6174 domain-containing protein [Bacteroidota bacterium]
MKRLILLVLALVLAACSAVPQTDLRRNQDKWQSSNTKDYRMSLFIGCFCGFTDRMPLTVEVHNGEVFSMAYADGKPVTPDDMNYQYFSRFSTIDRLFEDLQSGQASKADKIEITYDPTYGYPSQVNVDQIQNAVDDEYSVQISNFQVLGKL